MTARAAIVSVVDGDGRDGRKGRQNDMAVVVGCEVQPFSSSQRLRLEVRRWERGDGASMGIVVCRFPATFTAI